MPRRLLRNREVVLDDWLYVAEASTDRSAPLIVTFDQWQFESETWVARGSRLGIALSAVHKVEQLASALPHFDLIALDFSGPSDGRGYSQAKLLRERWHFTGELRAIGFVRRDQLFFMARCGFNSFELPEGELQGATAAFTTFTAAYQPSNDLGLAQPLRNIA
jgi:uncharacterized protein (DUF934 family)